MFRRAPSLQPPTWRETMTRWAVKRAVIVGVYLAMVFSGVLGDRGEALANLAPTLEEAAALLAQHTARRVAEREAEARSTMAQRPARCPGDMRQSASGGLVFHRVEDGGGRC